MNEMNNIKRIGIEFENGERILIDAAFVMQVEISMSAEGRSTLRLDMIIDTATWGAAQNKRPQESKFQEHSKQLPFRPRVLPEHKK